MLLVQKLLWLYGIGILCDGSIESPSDCHRSVCLTNLLFLAWNKFPHSMGNKACESSCIAVLGTAHAEI